MNHERSNLILTGMPGAGKSTVGVILAKRLGFSFVDTDLLIQMRTGRLLQETIDCKGLTAFRHLEERVLLEFNACNAVVATGGSAIYSEAAMCHLAAIGTIIFLDVPLDELEQRLHDMESRGLVIDPGSSLAELYAERLPRYRRWAKITIDEGGKNLEEVVEEICIRVNNQTR
ncbi:shikimate kinase [Geothermobacter hydrogeniphilus]|uniref:Shikimate kinase n=1 Tax=Geothermobacter hydrogeniphilus TaxID=1969733 RepID=A0A1X0XN54_9BACT|nr:shikimate kinase [Geothermobacter hydrogeniphilus]ORJ54290.1 shikimate kinase [Geothermobacter hydrogeniphilus]